MPGRQGGLWETNYRMTYQRLMRMLVYIDSDKMHAQVIFILHLVSCSEDRAFDLPGASRSKKIVVACMASLSRACIVNLCNSRRKELIA